jgi:hypothetical protein
VRAHDPTEASKMEPAGTSRAMSALGRQAGDGADLNAKVKAANSDSATHTKKPLDLPLWRRTLFRRSWTASTDRRRHRRQAIWRRVWGIMRHAVWITARIRPAGARMEIQQFVQMAAGRRVSPNNPIPIREEWPP